MEHGKGIEVVGAQIRQQVRERAVELRRLAAQLREQAAQERRYATGIREVSALAQRHLRTVRREHALDRFRHGEARNAAAKLRRRHKEVLLWLAKRSIPVEPNPATAATVRQQYQRSATHVAGIWIRHQTDRSDSAIPRLDSAIKKSA